MRAPDGSSTPGGTGLGPAAALLAGAVCLVYANSLGGSFHLDDFPFLLDNPAVRNFDIGGAMSSFPSRALAMGWLTLDAWMGNFSPLSFHLSAVLLHFLNSLLVFAIVRKMLCVFRPQAGGRIISASALAGALLFAVHPLQTQAVNYIFQRGVLLCSFFYMGALLAHIEYRETSSRIYLAVSLLCGLMALFSKETAYSLPGAVFLLDMLVFRRGLRASARMFLLFALLCVIPAIILTGSETYKDIDKLAGQGASPVWLYMLSQPRSILIYLRLLLVPTDLRLFYDLPLISGMGQAWPYFLGLGTLAGVYAFFLRRSRPALLFGGLFFVFLSVESSIVPLQDVIFEHRMYLPMLAAVSGAAFGFSFIEKRGTILGCSIALAAVLGAASVSRNGVWHSEMTLLEDNIQKAPASVPAAVNLGSAYLASGRADEARALFEKAVALNPRSGPALNNLGYILYASGDRAGAVRLFSRALEDNGYADEAAVNLGNCALEAGDRAGAERYFVLAGKISRKNIRARMNLGLARTLAGDYAGAKDAYLSAALVDGHNPAARFCAARACYLLRDYVCAAEQSGAALALQPENPLYRHAFGMSLIKSGRRAEGETQLELLRAGGVKLSQSETLTWK